MSITPDQYQSRVRHDDVSHRDNLYLTPQFANGIFAVGRLLGHAADLGALVQGFIWENTPRTPQPHAWMLHERDKESMRRRGVALEKA